MTYTEIILSSLEGEEEIVDSRYFVLRRYVHVAGREGDGGWRMDLFNYQTGEWDLDVHTYTTEDPRHAFGLIGEDAGDFAWRKYQRVDAAKKDG